MLIWFKKERKEWIVWNHTENQAEKSGYPEENGISVLVRREQALVEEQHQTEILLWK